MSFPSVHRKSSLTKLGIMLVLVLGQAMWVNAQTGDGQTTGAPPDPTQTQDTNSQGAGGAVPAATGIDTTTELSENPPLTGLDQPKFERAVVERSYLTPRAEVSQALDTNIPGNLSSFQAGEVTRALGSVELEKLWKVHPFDLSYIAGLDAYHGSFSQLYLVQALSATQRFLWRTGQFALRDSFSYLPEGTFGFSSYGGAGGFAAGGGLGGSTGGLGGTPGFTNTLFGSIGLQPRIANMASADVTQYLSPRGSLVLAGGFGLTDFLGTPQPSNVCPQPSMCYFNSNQTVAQAGYNYQISRRDQVAVAYAFEEFHFPGISGGSINANLWQLMYGHRITNRLNFELSGGPELVRTHETLPLTVFPGLTIPLTIGGKFLTGSARVEFVYRTSERTGFSASFWRFVNAGSGFYGGASTDATSVGFDHALKRQWNLRLTGGYSRNSRLLPSSAAIAGGAATYEFWYVNGSMRRQLGREFSLFMSYQYNGFGFGSGNCATGTCPNSYGRQIALIGIDWTPRPLRLD